MRTDRLVLIIIFFAALGAFSCSGTNASLEPDRSNKSKADTKGETPAVPAAASPAALPEVGDGDVKVLIADENAFGIDLYGQLRSRKGNLFFSPSSVSTALSMTYAGARGTTRDGMRKTLRYSLADEKIHQAFKTLTARPAQGQVILRVANRLWGQKGSQMEPAFLEVTRDDYDAAMKEADFASNAEKARSEINAWVSQETAGKIPELVPEGVITALTRLILVNAVYFKGKWAEPFDARLTRDAPFYIVGAATGGGAPKAWRGTSTLAGPKKSAIEEDCGSKVETRIMARDGEFLYAETGDLQVLEIPYQGNEIAMDILLPAKVDGLASIESKLDYSMITKYIGSLQKQHLKVYLPRFTLRSEFDLKESLSALGMKTAFEPSADFSGITGTNREWFIQGVLHQAFVEVNEEGTEAAAATAVHVAVMGAMVPQKPVSFEADHPFLFLIRNTQSGGILFMGRVENPSEKSAPTPAECKNGELVRKPLWCEGMYLHRPECEAFVRDGR